LNILKKSTRSEEETEELSELLTELGTDDLIEIFGEKYRNHTKYFIRLGSDYNKNIRKQMILDYIKELRNSTINSNLFSREKKNLKKEHGEDRNFYEIKKDIHKQMALNPPLQELFEATSQDITITVIAEQATSEHGHYEALLERFKNDQTKTNKWYSEGKVLAKEERTKLMQHFDNIFAFDENNNSLTNENKVSYQYKVWVSSQIKKIKENIVRKNAFAYEVNMESIEQLRQLLIDKFSPEQISSFLEGDNFMEFDVFSEQRLDEFVVKHRLKFLTSGNYKILIDDKVLNLATDLRREIKEGNVIKVIPVSEGEEAINPQFIKFKLNTILAKIEENPYINPMEKISQEELALIKLWWKSSDAPLYIDSQERNDSSPYTPHMQIFRYYLAMICENSEIGQVSSSKIGTLDKYLDKDISSLVAGLRLAPDNGGKFGTEENTIYRIYVQIEQDLVNKINSKEDHLSNKLIDDLIDLNDLFRDFLTILGHETDFLFVSTKLFFHRWANILRFPKNFNKDPLISHNDLTSLDDFLEGVNVQIYIDNIRKTIRKIGKIERKRDSIDKIFLDFKFDVENKIKDESLAIQDKSGLFDKIYKFFEIFKNKFPQEENIFELTQERGSHFEKCILIRRIGHIIEKYFEYSEEFPIDIAAILTKVSRFSKFMFNDEYTLKAGFLAPSLIEGGHLHTYIWEVQDNILFKTYKNFLELFSEKHRTYIRKIFDIDRYNSFKKEIANEINDWCFDNPLKAPYVTQKGNRQYNLYGGVNPNSVGVFWFDEVDWTTLSIERGDKLEWIDFKIIHNLWSLLSEFYEKNLPFTDLAEKSNLASDSFTSLFNKGVLLTKEKIDSIIESLEDLSRSISKNDILYDRFSGIIKNFKTYKSQMEIFYKQNKKKVFQFLSENYEYDVHLQNIPKDWESLRNGLEMTYWKGGSMPDAITQVVSSGQFIEYRISKFSKSPWTTNPQNINDYRDLNSILFNNVLIEHNNPVRNDLQLLNDIVAHWRKHKDEIPEKWHTKYEGGDHHDFILPKIFEECKDIVIAKGVNLYIQDPSTGVMITGHIDLIIKIDNNIIICDYKPNLDLDLMTDYYGKMFIKCVPQLGVYGLVFERMYGQDWDENINLFCYAFNKDDGNLFRPLPSLWLWRNAYHEFIHPEDPELLPWEYLIPQETQYKWWDQWRNGWDLWWWENIYNWY